MIWFECPQCGKQHARPENSSGSMVFCTCGFGMTVPWESTIPEPALPENLDAMPVPPAPPRYEPIPIGEERIPPPPPPPQAAPPPPPPSDTPPPRGYPPPPMGPTPARRPESRTFGPRVPDPKVCLNHEHLASEHACESCGEKFCSHCVIRFEGKTWCGPCKNLRVRSISRPVGMSAMAWISVILGLMVGPAGFCLMPMGRSGNAIVVAIVILLVQAIAISLGFLAILRSEKKKENSGNSLAITGIISGGIGVLLTAAAIGYMYFQWI